MGAFADSLFTVMLSWVRSAVGAIITAFSSGGESGLLNFLGRNWVPIVLIVLAIGLVGDWFTWMVRWQPYRVWGTHVRRVARALGIGKEQAEDEDEQPEYTDNAPEAADEMGQTALYQMSTDSVDFAPETAEDMPVTLTPEDEQAAYEAADMVEDAALGDYPGKRYDQSAFIRPVGEDAPPFAQEQASSDAQPVYEAEPVYEETQPVYETEPVYEDAQPVYETEPVYEAAQPIYESESVYAQEPAPQVPPDVEFAYEIDPLAAYDDPAVLERFKRPQPDAPEYDVQPSITAPFVQDEPEQPTDDEQETGTEATTSRRRRRRREVAYTAAPLHVLPTPASQPLEDSWDPPFSPREQAARARTPRVLRARQPGAQGERKLSVLTKLLDQEQEDNPVLPPRVDYQEAFKPPVAPEGWKDE